MPPVRATRLRSAALLGSTVLATAIVAGCGSSDGSTSASSTAPAPAASAFPATSGGSIEDLIASSQQTNDLVASPAGSVYTKGDNRFAFAVFKVDRTQVSDAEVAIYAAHGPTGKVEGPYPARSESLATDPAFTSQTTATDPDAAKGVYVSDVPFDKSGEWRLLAVVKGSDGFTAVRMPSVVVDAAINKNIPDVGDKAPVVHTPTVNDVGDITQIDTRQPPDDMHDVDLADVIGKQPVVLMFATPALCQSRVCGPVVDVAEQVKQDHPDGAAFIHMEIYVNNTPPARRPQLKAYGLHTEPWTFIINSDGTISSRIEGALSVSELENALDKAT
jgi:hypothetical protein